MEKIPSGVFEISSQSNRERLIFTTGNGIFHSCKSYDSNYLHDCHNFKKTDITLDKHGISFQDKVEVGSVKYQLNVKKNLKFNPEVDVLPTSCPDQSTKFEADNIRENVERWLKTLSHPENDPFWMVAPSPEPLNQLNPIIDIQLQTLKGRNGFENVPIEIWSTRKRLFKGELHDGRLYGKVESETDPTHWSAPLHFYFSLGKILRDENVPQFINHDKEEAADVVGRLKNGKLHGPVRMFFKVSNDPKNFCGGKIFNQELSFVGHMADGIPSGYCWKGLLGGAWIHGKVNEQGEFTGNDIAYVYPDFKTALVGKFENGIMVCSNLHY